MRFAELTAPEIRALSRDATLVVAPVAACEQHGPHLPVFTDSILCGAVADGVEAALRERVLVLPVLWLGASEHHLPFGGTLTATLPTYETILVELLRPLLRDGFRRVLILNGHGGNIDPLRVALRRLDVEFPGAVLTGAAYWEIAEPELAALCRGSRTVMGHACELETSMMLHLRPDLVRSDHLADDPDDTPEGLRGIVWARDFARRTHHGAVGYPEQATAESGKAMLDAIIARVAAVAERLLSLPTEQSVRTL
jgi:creatinine amidohydrolase